MRFSIITPSFRNSEWLKLCIASVADQAGVESEHIIQDAGSDDGTLEWLPADPRVKAYVEKDGGMYDAVNRGIRRATGEIIAYLNCDEQYLPGALAAVEEFLKSHPAADVLVADAVVTAPDGSYICHRKAQAPHKQQLWFRMPVLTCAMFVRRRVFEREKLFFDTSLRTSGDYDWIKRVVGAGLRIAVLRRFTSAFTETGSNLDMGRTGIEEREMQIAKAPPLARKLKFAIVLSHRLRSLVSGIYFQSPFTYSIYTQQNPGGRTDFFVPKPTQIWKSRL